MIKLISKKNRLFMVVLMLFFVISVPTTIFAAQKKMNFSGWQIRGHANANARLKSYPVRVKKTSKIIAIHGDNRGFWIASRNGIVAKYYRPNDKRAIGLTLKPGLYFVYPNLKRGQTRAYVEITIQENK